MYTLEVVDFANVTVRNEPPKAVYWGFYSKTYTILTIGKFSARSVRAF